MWRRYVLAFAGAAAGGAPPLALGLGLDFRLVAAMALAVAGGAVALGERWRLVPTSEEAARPLSLFAGGGALTPRGGPAPGPAGAPPPDPPGTPR